MKGAKLGSENLVMPATVIRAIKVSAALQKCKHTYIYMQNRNATDDIKRNVPFFMAHTVSLMSVNCCEGFK